MELGEAEMFDVLAHAPIYSHQRGKAMFVDNTCDIAKCEHAAAVTFTHRYENHEGEEVERRLRRCREHYARYRGRATAAAGASKKRTTGRRQIDPADFDRIVAALSAR
jgi:hypothetical protein